MRDVYPQGEMIAIHKNVLLSWMDKRIEFAILSYWPGGVDDSDNRNLKCRSSQALCIILRLWWRNATWVRIYARTPDLKDIWQGLILGSLRSASICFSLDVWHLQIAPENWLLWCQLYNVHGKNLFSFLDLNSATRNVLQLLLVASFTNII